MTTTADAPIRVKDLNSKIGAWISKLGHVHVEGQLTQINARPGTRTAFLTLRDPDASASVSITAAPELLSSTLAEGARVVVYGKPSFWQGRGSLSLRASAITEIGEGELLARQDQLRNVLRTEGAFEPGRKRPVPFAPAVIGLVTGRASAAERDVCSIIEARWPAATVRVRNTPVQGASTVPKVIEAIQELDRLDDVEVIIVARGGGSVEDLLPFSDEKLLRAVIACKTPVMSAIGHEPDHPILDDVADFRAATPTDAAKSVVPDCGVEIEWTEAHARVMRRAVDMAVERARDQLGRAANTATVAVRTTLAAERHGLQRIRTHNTQQVRRVPTEVQHHLTVTRPVVLGRARQVLNTQQHEVARHRSTLADLWPQGVLDRGYAVVRTSEGRIVRTVDDIDSDITITTSAGTFELRVQKK